MTRLLLDTTFLIDADRVGGALDELVDDADDVAVAAITVAELEVGVLLADSRLRRARRAFLDDVLATVPVLEYDRAVASVHAELLVEVRRRGTSRGAHDLIIAATARASARAVVTADLRAFRRLPGVDVRPLR